MSKGYSFPVAARLAIFSAILILGVVAAQFVLTYFRPSDLSEQDTRKSSSLISTKNSQLDESLVSIVPPPKGLDDFVVNSDLIVIGEIKEFLRETYEGPYGGIRVIDLRDVPSQELPFTYYTLKITEVISNRTSTQLGDSILLRLSGHASESTDEIQFPFPKIGERKLYGLSANPDGQSYGYSFGGWGALNIDDNVITYSDNRKTRVKFAEQGLSDKFLDELRARAK